MTSPLRQRVRRATPRGTPLLGAGNTVVAGEFLGTWASLGELPAPPVAAFLVSDQLAAARAAWTHAITRRESLVATAARVDGHDRDDLLDDGFAVLEGAELARPGRPRDPDAGRVWLLTSGTTGRPKRVAHTLDSLTTVRGHQPPRTWLCPYTPGAYAWWQVVTLSMSQVGQDVVFVEPDRLDDWPRIALEYGVTAVSGTPTFWRRALWQAAHDLARLPVRQVTLGGEPVDQGILDRLAATYPDARISWIYASSEAGAAVAVHDGLAGFPADWLDRAGDGRPTLSVQDGELVVESQWSAPGLDGPLHTGDRADVVGGRVLITGRATSDEINVGGSKVSAGRVRAVLQDHPGVLWARVRGRTAPLVGALVVADLVLQEPLGEVALADWCRARLPDHAVPRRWRVLDEIPIKESLKSDV